MAHNFGMNRSKMDYGLSLCLSVAMLLYGCIAAVATNHVVNHSRYYLLIFQEVFQYAYGCKIRTVLNLLWLICQNMLNISMMRSIASFISNMTNTVVKYVNIPLD